MGSTAAFTVITLASATDLIAAKAAEASLTSTDYVDYGDVTAALAMDETTTTEAIAKTTAINDAIEALVTNASVVEGLITALPAVADLVL